MINPQYRIVISEDGHWAGQGFYRESGDGGEIECAAQVGGEADKLHQHEIYSALEDAVAACGFLEGECEIYGRQYSWRLEETEG